MGKTLLSAGMAAALTLISSAAPAQEFAYLLNTAGPRIQTSRCFFLPGGICSGSLTTIDLSDSVELGTEPLGLSTFDSLVASSDGRTLVWALWGGGVGAFDRVTRVRRQILGDVPSDVTSGPVLFAAPRGDVFYRGRTGAVDVFDLTGPLETIELQTSGRSMAITADATTGYVPTDSGIGVLDLALRTLASEIALPAGETDAVAATPDGTIVFALRRLTGTTAPERTLYRVAATSGTIATSRTVANPGDLVVSPDGTRLWISEGNYYYGSSSGGVRVLRSDTLEEIAHVTVGSPIGGLSMSADGARLLVTTTTSLHEIDTATATITRSIPLTGTFMRRPAVLLPASAPCVFRTTPRAFTVPPNGRALSISVPAQPGCVWDVRWTQSWVYDVSPVNGMGPADVGFSVGLNSATGVRSTTIMIAGQTITVVQTGETIQPGTPGAPFPLSIDLRTGRVAFLRWTPPIGGPAATHFVIEVGSRSGERDIATIPVGLQPAASGGPIENRTYYVRVKAANAAGTGPPSNEIVVDPSRTPGPISMTMAWNSPATGTLMWYESVSSSVRYQIEVPASWQSPALPTFQVEGRGLALHRDLFLSDVYAVQIRGINDAGVIGPVPLLGPTYVRGRNCDATPSSPSIAALVVSAPFAFLGMTAASSQPFDAFRIMVGRTPGATDVGQVDVTATSVFAPLPRGTYYVRVATVNRCGTSAPSAEWTFAIP